MAGSNATTLFVIMTLSKEGCYTMNISDRIQNLRKAKGISQEELAGKVGVSRQAVSKWESEQSIPDLDKVIIMSDYFGVTTDYILKGIEQSEQTEKKANAGIFVIVATVLNFIGLVVSAAVWYEEQVPMALVIGLIFMALGCMVFGIGILNSSESTKKNAKYYFGSINIWLLSFIPLSFIYNVLLTGMIAPYPLIVSPIIAFPVFWVIYIAVCLGVDLVIARAKRRV
ncbi:helix-turn-helix transcriptional regulator [Desulforamulus ruminis]|nr:helix-turn-helix transcriptional regulator [Desulforamulus ruminis]